MKIGRLLLRLTVGGFFFGHGTQKLFGWFGGKGFSTTAQGMGTYMRLRPARLWNHALMFWPKMPTPIRTTMAMVAISNPYSTTSCPSSSQSALHARSTRLATFTLGFRRGQRARGVPTANPRR